MQIFLDLIKLKKIAGVTHLELFQILSLILGHVKRIWYISPMRAAKVQASLHIHAVSPEPPLLTHISSESRGTFKQKARSLAPLNGWACTVKICHDRMLEDTNSLDAAHFFFYTLFTDAGTLPYRPVSSPKLNKNTLTTTSFSLKFYENDNIMLSTTPIIVTSKSLVRARLTTLYCQLHQLLWHQSRWLEQDWQRYDVNYTNYCDIKVVGKSQNDNVILSTTPIIVTSKSLVRARLTTLWCQLHQLLWHQSRWLEPEWQRYVVNYTNYWDIKVVGKSQIDNVMLSTTPIIVTSKSLIRAIITTLYCQLHQLLWHQSCWLEPDWQRYIVNYTNYCDIKVVG